MKKFIAQACALSLFTLALGVAHAGDTSDTPSSDSTQQPGISGTESITSKVDSEGNKLSSKTKSMKTCTDSKGTVYENGKQGFEDCVAQMKKSMKSNEQMGGTKGPDAESHSHDSMTPESSATESGSSN